LSDIFKVAMVRGCSKVRRKSETEIVIGVVATSTAEGARTNNGAHKKDNKRKQ